MSKKKNFITIIKEYCDKKALPGPSYEFRGLNPAACLVNAFGEVGVGVGHSRREAKLDAATNLIIKLQLATGHIPQDLGKISTSNAVADLLDTRLKEKHPLAGSDDGVEFTPESKASEDSTCVPVSEEAVALKLAAQQNLEIVRQLTAPGTSKGIIPFGLMGKEMEATNRKKIKAYKEYIQMHAGTNNKDSPEVAITDRHNFFKNLPIEKKNKAHSILNDQSIMSSKERVDLTLKALEIPYKVQEIPAKNGSMTFVELFCSLNPVFADRKDLIYDEIIKYFHDMLW